MIASKLNANKNCFKSALVFLNKHSQLQAIKTSHFTTSNHLANKLSYCYSRFGLNLIGTNVRDKLAETAILKPNDLAYKFCFTQTSYSFGELKTRVDEMAQSLLNMGFKVISYLFFCCKS
jgi:hypothetical protein